MKTLILWQLTTLSPHPDLQKSTLIIWSLNTEADNMVPICTVLLGSAVLSPCVKESYSTSIMLPRHSCSPCWHSKVYFCPSGFSCGRGQGQRLETNKQLIFSKINVTYLYDNTIELQSNRNNNVLGFTAYHSVSVGNQLNSHDVRQQDPGREESIHE